MNLIPSCRERIADNPCCRPADAVMIPKPDCRWQGLLQGVKVEPEPEYGTRDALAQER